MNDLLSVDEAVSQILAPIQRLGPETVALEESLGRVLAEDVRAETDLPPFANSSMDGFAVRAADVQNGTLGRAKLKVVMDIPAGSAPQQPIQGGEAARIMTGAPLPEGADAVIPVEDTDSSFEGTLSPLPYTVTIYTSTTPGSNVRPAGEDVRAGDVVLEAGTLIRAQEIGALAALGKGNVQVIRRPRVAVLATGDELVGIDEPLTPGKIRETNGYTVAALVTSHGGTAMRLPTARDTLDDVRRVFQQAIDLQPDLILSSAGVSVGALDYVRTVLAELGEVNFWRVNLRPGKPLAYGQLGGVPFFGLPGNPVSTMITFDIFVRPVLLRMGGRSDTSEVIEAITAQAMTSDGRRTYVRVKLTREHGRVVARPTGTQSSGALTSMVRADGLMIIPEGVTSIPAGASLPVRLLKAFM